MDDKIPFEEIIADLNEQSGKKFRHKSAITQSLIRARFRDGFTLADFKKVHRIKAAEWRGTDMDQYLCPTTLYRPSKFEKYLNQIEPQSQNMAEFGIP